MNNILIHYVVVFLFNLRYKGPLSLMPQVRTRILYFLHKPLCFFFTQRLTISFLFFFFFLIHEYFTDWTGRIGHRLCPNNRSDRGGPPRWFSRSISKGTPGPPSEIVADLVPGGARVPVKAVSITNHLRAGACRRSRAAGRRAGARACFIPGVRPTRHQGRSRRRSSSRIRILPSIDRWIPRRIPAGKAATVFPWPLPQPEPRPRSVDCLGGPKLRDGPIPRAMYLTFPNSPETVPWVAGPLRIRFVCSHFFYPLVRSRGVPVIALLRDVPREARRAFFPIVRSASAQGDLIVKSSPDAEEAAETQRPHRRSAVSLSIISALERFPDALAVRVHKNRHSPSPLLSPW